MLSLHQAVDETRGFLKWGGIIIGAIVAIFLLYSFGNFLYTLFSPPPPPTVSFGKLPPLAFPENKITQKFTYSINTLTGTLPSFPDRATINKILQPQPTIQALTQMQQRVENVGFTSPGTALSSTLYQWNESTPPFRTMIADITSNNFTLTSQFLQDEAVLAGANVPSEQQAITIAQEFLENMELLPQDLDGEKTKTTLLSIVDGKLTQAESFASTQVVRADFFQNDVNDLPIYYPNTPQSIINFYLASSQQSQAEIDQAEFIHHTITDTTATYPIKTADQALTDLKNGKGYIVSYEGSETEIAIDDMSLGYYLGRQSQQYLMPIVVFKGKDNFVAYVSAVTDAWVGK